MESFDNFNKKEKECFNQDLTQKEEQNSVFIMNLLMKEKCSMPNKETMTEIIKRYLGDVECFCYEENVSGFSLNDHKVEFKDGPFPAQLMITGCMDRIQIDEFTKSQMWDCQEERDRILKECKYQVIATDMLSKGMDYKERADMLMDYMEALLEIYPECEAIVFQNSGKMFTAIQIREHKIQREKRFIYFAVNVRFFNIQGTNDMIVDTLGMSILDLPDLQYHFHDMDPNWVVNHAYNLLCYIYDNNDPIESGETVAGISEGNMDVDIYWKCNYEDSLIQPVRLVLDICMNDYASGKRDYK